MTSADSIVRNDSLRYETPKGKVVYGGGGIIPDVFVPVDTVGVTDLLVRINRQALAVKYSSEVADRYRSSPPAAESVWTAVSGLSPATSSSSSSAPSSAATPPWTTAPSIPSSPRSTMSYRRPWPRSNAFIGGRHHAVARSRGGRHPAVARSSAFYHNGSISRDLLPLCLRHLLSPPVIATLSRISFPNPFRNGTVFRIFLPLRKNA